MRVPDPLPARFPEDEALMAEARSIATGADIHDINCAIGAYGHSIRLYDMEMLHSKEKHDRSYNMAVRSYRHCVEWERHLRGIVAEGRIGRARDKGWIT